MLDEEDVFKLVEKICLYLEKQEVEQLIFLVKNYRRSILLNALRFELEDFVDGEEP